jgi:hypothetical protein
MDGIRYRQGSLHSIGRTADNGEGHSVKHTQRRLEMHYTIAPESAVCDLCKMHTFYLLHGDQQLIGPSAFYIKVRDPA